MKPVIACGTSDGVKLCKSNFKEAPQFYLYRIKAREIQFLKEIDNFTHQNNLSKEDDQKIERLTSLLKSQSANIILAHQMGPSLVKISKKFLPILSRELKIEEALEQLKNQLHLIEREWRKGEKREHLVLENLQN